MRFRVVSVYIMSSILKDIKMYVYFPWNEMKNDLNTIYLYETDFFFFRVRHG